MTPVRFAKPENCGLCRGTETVQIKGEFTGRLYPCPECRMRDYTVTLDVTGFEIANAQPDKEEFVEDLKRTLKERLFYELVEYVGEVTRTYDRGEDRYQYMARLVVVHPRTKEKS